jgi:uncharacterized protein YndB with AHSA1/START domain
MATTHITPNNNAVLAEIFIAAPPDRVFQALTDPAQMPLWWGEKGMYRITECKNDLRPGGKWVSAGVGADGKSFQVDGEYTTVRVELEPRDVHGLQHRGPQRVGTGTLVKIRHEGFAGDSAQAKGHGEGWARVLGWMKAFVETGATLDARSEQTL